MEKQQDTPIVERGVLDVIEIECANFLAQVDEPLGRDVQVTGGRDEPATGGGLTRIEPRIMADGEQTLARPEQRTDPTVRLERFEATRAIPSARGVRRGLVGGGTLECRSTPS